jgi:hypothetical protein
MQGYEARVRMEGLNDLYEQAFVHAAGHCTENVSEIAAAVETMMYRLDTGHWRNSTEPNVMNEVADSFAIDIPRFTKHELRPFNRSFYPDSAYPGDP